jgi:hypothetical protein
MTASPVRTFVSALAGAALGAVLFASGAAAHHGWSWAEEDQVELDGVVREVFIGPPHPVLKVEAEDGLWTVELGNPTQTQRSGFAEASAKVGDKVTALGNKSTDEAEKRMKAVRLTVGDKVYDIYPDRIRK